MAAAPYCTCGAPKNAPSTLDFHNPSCPRIERYPGETAALREALKAILAEGHERGMAWVQRQATAALEPRP